MVQAMTELENQPLLRPALTHGGNTIQSPSTSAGSAIATLNTATAQLCDEARGEVKMASPRASTITDFSKDQLDEARARLVEKAAENAILSRAALNDATIFRKDHSKSQWTQPFGKYDVDNQKKNMATFFATS